MHELSIADAVLSIALEHAADRRIERVKVRAGHLRQVVPDALTFAFGLVSEGTAAEGAELALEQVAVEVRCRACGMRSEQGGFPLRCPACGGLDLEIVSGEELLVDEIDLSDEPLLQEA